jgi:hypothetical protein
MTIAYAELAGRGSVHDVDALDGTLASLRLCASRAGSSRTNVAALAVLQGVRRLVRARRAQRIARYTTERAPPAYEPQHAWVDDEWGDVVDPYSGMGVELPEEESPPTPPSLSWYPVPAQESGGSQWDEWEALFRGFLEA